MTASPRTSKPRPAVPSTSANPDLQFQVPEYQPFSQAWCAVPNKVLTKEDIDFYSYVQIQIQDMARQSSWYIDVKACF